MPQKVRTLSLTVDVRVLLGLLLTVALLAGGWYAVRATTPPDPNNPNAEQPAAPAAAAPAQPAPPSGSLSPNGDAPQPAAVEPAGALAPEAVASFAGARHFYLTNFDRTANTPKTACAAGYHFASLWEIYDVSNLTYAYTHPNAAVKADDGRGVLSHWYGWVRTGWDNSTVNIAGQANCAVWTSTNVAHFGTIARLNYNWDVSVGAVGAWEADTWYCGGTAPVWCIED